MKFKSIYWFNDLFPFLQKVNIKSMANNGKSGFIWGESSQWCQKKGKRQEKNKEIT